MTFPAATAGNGAVAKLNSSFIQKVQHGVWKRDYFLPHQKCFDIKPVPASFAQRDQIHVSRCDGKEIVT